MAGRSDHHVLVLTTEAAIRLALLAVIVVACLQIFWPFALSVIWGIIIAIALWPVFRRLRALLGGRQKLAATTFALVALAALLIPSWLLAESTVDALSAAGSHLASGEHLIPRPPERVSEWPIIGERLAEVWNQAMDDPPKVVHAYRHEITAVGRSLLSLVAGIGFGILQFAFSIVLAAAFLATAKAGTNVANVIADRIAGEERGRALVETAAQTVGSVVRGVLGVALVQGTAATAGMMLAGVPGASGWGLLVTFLAIAQLPPLLVMVPMIFYVSGTASTAGATAFAIWSLLVSVSDGFLKPLFLGRGVDVPMLVILIGAIGGMLAWGVLGLFVGAVVFAVGFQLARAWFVDPDIVVESGDPPAS